MAYPVVPHNRTVRGRTTAACPLLLPARSLVRRPVVEDHVVAPLVSVKTEPEDDSARVVDYPVAVSHGAAKTRDAADRETSPQVNFLSHSCT